MPFVIAWLDSPHPSSSLPTVRLVSLTLRHPDADGVAAALVALGLADTDQVELEQGASPEMRAMLDTPRGLVELR